MSTVKNMKKLSILLSECINCARISSYKTTYKMYEEQFKILSQKFRICNALQEINFT